MSINAINSVSLYEYYYTINNKKKEDKNSPIKDEMREYGLEPTEDDALNVTLLKRAKELQAMQDNSKTTETTERERPWSDLMYQLNLEFNEDPRDDIQDIKEKLATLLSDIEDEELEEEINDLNRYVEELYVDFEKLESPSIDRTIVLDNQLSNFSMLNQVNLARS